MAAIGFAGAAVALSWSAGPDPPWVRATLHLVGLVLIVAGLLLRLRPVSRRLAVLVIALGLSWYAIDLKDSQVLSVHGVGSCLYFLHLVVLGHLLLAYPSGRLPSAFARAVIVVAYASDVILQTLRYATERMTTPGRLLTAAQRPMWAELGAVAGLALTLVVVALIVYRWWTASRPARRYLPPAWVIAVVAITLTSVLVAGALDISEAAEHRLLAAHGLALALLAVAGTIVVFQVRTARVGVADVLVHLERSPDPDGLQRALSQALRDPQLRLAIWDSEHSRYVDSEGEPVDLSEWPPPPRPDEQMVTTVDLDGELLAAVVHDPALAQQPELMRAMLAAVRLVLDNTRQLTELRLSRTRIVQAEIAGRRQVQRDLHDGAQQDLIALSLSLRQLREILSATVRDSDHEAELCRLVDQAIAEADQVAESLHQLARGVLPAVLTHFGLDEAIQELARRCTVPVHCDIETTECSADAAAATYFLVSEALANVAKHAGASQAVVQVRRREEHLVIQITDNGRGGADPRQGTGLKGLRDRLEAFGGRLEITTSPRGTAVTGYVPCG
jgi:signal transduction histidine kinase